MRQERLDKILPHSGDSALKDLSLQPDGKKYICMAHISSKVDSEIKYVLS